MDDMLFTYKLMIFISFLTLLGFLHILTSLESIFYSVGCEYIFFILSSISTPIILP
ncbi:uncharacterized protein BYT42DRAFT_583017 [Radiomyces spectabilis]|uniref:uncharacterized protein n=1 Tax=Radiomyces spectabilis TaxID=64574 RepID=UPI00221E3E69|nr:uncharacterized protein BYT42DRAFT_583017 [Radiomyces spectabilis]KAI8370609.1 hypothetical protein BYT42DRAFT_583017 [Radiomyces spectabilis]